MRRATQGDVARRAGVSQALVSLAYRGAPGVGAETREKILSVARELNYAPNANAANLASKSTDSIGIFLLNLHNELFGDIFDGIRLQCGPTRNQLVISVGSDDGAAEAHALAALVGARVGVIIAAGLLESDRDIRRLAQTIPVVAAARKVPQIDSVYSDDFDGAQQAARHLIELGHRRIAHLASPQSDGYSARRAGYLGVMNEAGLAAEVVEVGYGGENATREVSLLMSRSEPPTAIFANNDQAALGALEALAARGLRCPDDLSLVGYDNIGAGSLPGIDLTTVDILGAEIGQQSARVAIRRMLAPDSEPADVSLKPRFILRASTVAIVNSKA